MLKAALNHAFHEGKVASDEPWRKVKPFREADSAVVRYLSTSESVRLVNACEAAFRDLVGGALVTGCRYGELTRMRAADFNAAVPVDHALSRGLRIGLIGIQEHLRGIGIPRRRMAAIEHQVAKIAT